MIKTVMMLERRFILPNYDFKKANEMIPFSKWNLKVRRHGIGDEGNAYTTQVPITQRPWPTQKRFASVNNFGFGGTNAHVVLERAPFIKKNDDEDDSALQFQLLTIRTAQALQRHCYC